MSKKVLMKKDLMNMLKNVKNNMEKKPLKVVSLLG
tara:strand:- start:35 stop:139 length:105 start_codon:yes stop_codon:yes gene_type:complete